MFEFGVQHSAERDEHSSEAAAMFQFMLSPVKTSQRVIDPVGQGEVKRKSAIPAVG